MSHRTQITLTDALYARLRRESERTGVSLAELIRRALAVTYAVRDPADAGDILAASFGAWKDRSLDGAAYVESLRRGMAQRLSE